MNQLLFLCLLTCFFERADNIPDFEEKVLLNKVSKMNPAKNNSEDIWQLLMSVEYRTWRQQYIPDFDDKIKALDGKKIIIEGYMYPLEESSEHSYFMLSYYPVNMCFFCGSAGPETVMEVNMQSPIKLYSKKITLTGTLQLNADDPDRLFYILLDTELL